MDLSHPRDSLKPGHVEEAARGLSCLCFTCHHFGSIFDSAVRCAYCGLWFCEKCAKAHFATEARP